MASTFPVLTAAEAAKLIKHNDMVGVSGFTPAGAPKAVPRALAARAKALHASGEEFKIRLISGASTGAACDDELCKADAVSWRAPYMSSDPLRKLANTGKLDFVDMHLSHVSQMVMEGFLGNLDIAIIEATDITPSGKVYLTTAIGNSPAFLHKADKVIIEINTYHSPRLREMADIVLMPVPPYRHAIPITHCLDRIGQQFADVDPSKVIGVVYNHESDGGRPFVKPDCVCKRLAQHVASFLLEEISVGRIPKSFLPLQSGVGNVCNAVLSVLAASDDFPQFDVYTEVLQDATLNLMASGAVRGASACSLSLTDEKLAFLYDNMDDFVDRIIMRPQEISNNPGVARRLGVIATNTAIEVDIYGHANSTHFYGTQMMNGLGGSGDFERNAFISILMCPSVAKGGRISTVVPMCSHVDHSEHSIQAICTEWGLADLRGLAPAARAERIIETCAHPAYRPYLHKYVESAPMGHIRHNLRNCFELYANFQDYGAMLPDLDLDQFIIQPSI